MKKTSFTFAKTSQRQVLVNAIKMVFTLATLLVGNFAFGQVGACDPGSGNTVSNCPAVGPVTVTVDGACNGIVPDLRTGVSGTAGAGFLDFGPIQNPIAGSVLSGTGNKTVQVANAFVNTTTMTLCAVYCSDVTLSYVDNIAPSINCIAPITVDVDTNCQLVLDSAAEVLQFVSILSDNCTAQSSISLSVDVNNDLSVESYPVTLAGPTCPGSGTISYTLRIIATDASGNTASCVSTPTLRDNTSPSATCPGNQTVAVNSAFGVCNGTFPDFTSLVTGISDNCDAGPSYTMVQSPTSGTILGLSSSCDTLKQPTAITVYDCFGNGYTCNFTTNFVDNSAPAITGSCPPTTTTLYADSNCDVNVPNLSAGIAAQDNCSNTASGTLTLTQSPIGSVNKAGLCPGTNTIDITFTPKDCFGNTGTPLVCTALVTVLDTVAPVVVCPATPILVPIPFNPLSCEHGTATVTLADAIAAGVTVTDNCDNSPTLGSVLPNMFMCEHMGKAGLTVTITALDCFSNTDTSVCAVTVIPDSDQVADWSLGGSDYIVCPTDFPLTLVPGPNTPGCGTWSGDLTVSVSGSGVGAGAWSGTIAASAVPDTDGDGLPGPGVFSLTYTVGSYSCDVAETHNIIISPTFVAGDATLVSDFTICWSATETFDLEGLLASGAVQGGAFSVSTTGSLTGQQIGNLFQYTGGDGNLVVTYTLTDCDGNPVSDQVVISVDEKPEGHFTLPAAVCQDAGVLIPVVTDVPFGANISFASTPAGFITNALTGAFNPAAGLMPGESVTVQVTMTVTNGVCANHINTQVVVVSASGDPSFAIPATICESDADLTLSLTSLLSDNGVNPLIASNVNWTGTSVTDNGTTGAFDPSVGPGTYTICVTVGAPSCEETVCHDITVIEDYTAAEVALDADFSLCIFKDDVIDFSSLLAATAKPGGVFTAVQGAGLAGGVINANGYVYKGGCGTLTVTYSFPGDCVPNSDQIVITIEEKPDAGNLALDGPLCAEDAPITLTYGGTSAVCGNNGVFSGNGVTDGGNGTAATFNPATAGEGTHTVTYAIGNQATGCYVEVSGDIEVRASSDPAFTVPGTACANEVVALALDSADPSVLPSSPDSNVEITWLGGDGVNAIVTDNGNGTGTFVGKKAGTYTVCVITGDLGCTQYTCRQITVDNVAPVLNCGPTVRTRANALDACTYTAAGTEFNVTATDNCVPPNGAASLVLTHNYAPHIGTNANSLAGAVFPVGITQIVWTATDTAGNAASCTIQIQVNDTQAPVVQSCPSNIAQGTDADICGAAVTYTLPQFSDNCDGTSLEGVMISGLTSGSDFPLGVTTVTWTYQDLADNGTATCTFTVTITDDVDPVAVCQPAITLTLDGAGQAQLTADDVDLASSDNCGITSTLISRGAGFAAAQLFYCADLGTQTVTLQLIDAAGNVSTCDATVSVLDLQVPDIECSSNIYVGTDAGACSAVVTYPAPTVTDNCSAPVTLTSGLASGSTFPAGTTTQVFTATDAAGNSESCSFTVTVSDSEAPVIDCGPTVRTVFADAGQCSYTVAGAAFDASFTDNCAGGSLAHNYATAAVAGTLAGSTFPVGTTLVTWQATDAAGYTSDICGIQIVVLDNQNPTISCGSNVTVNADPGLCSFKVTSTAVDPSFGDNCGATVSHNYASAPSSSTANGAVFPLGSTIVTWTATDAAGNTASCSYTVTVVDNQTPNFVNCPTTMTMIGNDPDQCSGKLNWAIPVATDNCGIASVVQTGGPASGSVFPVGAPQTITYTATDVNGLTKTCVFQVQVVDTQKPDFDADIVMPTNITVQCNAIPSNCVFHGNGICSPLTSGDVNDNCTANITPVFNEVSTQGANVNNCNHYNYTLTRTWTLTDAAGNSRVHTQVITVIDDTDPAPVCQNTTVTLDKAGNGSINPVSLAVGTTDVCAPFSALNITASKTAFDCSNLGANNVTLTITDPCGNSSTCGIVVTVVEGIGSCTPGATLASSCLNNATTLTNGQFSERITIKALAMQTWTVTSSNGLFTSGSAAPPAAPTAVANGTLFVAGHLDGIDNNGVNGVDEADEMVFYTLNAKYVEAIGYSATLTNNIGQTLTVSNVAHYPTPMLVDFFDPFCYGTDPFVPQVVDQFAGAGAYTSVSFLVDGAPVTQLDPSSLSLGQHTLTIIADGGAAAFSRKVNGNLVAGDAADSDAARLNPGCVQSTSVFFTVVTTPAQVVCNDQVHVTLEGDCSSIVTPDMVLEGTYPCFDDYEVRISLPNNVPLNPANVVTAAHAGLNLNYVLWHPISGNTCWGHLSVEDLTDPTVTCPSNKVILCVEDPDALLANGQLATGIMSVTDCSSWNWEYTDDYTTFDCAANPGVAEIITRTFVVTDEFGNQGSCTQTITKERGEVSQISLPGDPTYSCNDPLLNTLAPAFSPAVTGWPKIGGVNLTTSGTGVCGLGVSYTDEVVNICAASYKVVRTWKIFDWCPASGSAPTVVTHVQYIKVENVAPTVTVNCQTVNSQGYCVLNATEPGNPPHVQCSAIFIPAAEVDGGCDGIKEITVETPAGNTTNGGFVPAPGLPIGGPYEIIYRAEDLCGNITEYVLTVVVEDQTAPVAICDEVTDVNLSSDGVAEVFAATYDDGSYDGCCLNTFAVRKMVDNCADNHNDLEFGPSVYFCCEDIGAPAMVVFRVYDCNGNYNDCMVSVTVNDKQKPIVVSCPANQRTDCDFYANDLELQLGNLAGNAAAQSQLLDQYYGAPEFIDNCDFNVNRTFSANIDQCLEGTITRSWTAVDPSGNASTVCTQTIFVDHVSDWVIEFPADLTVNCGSTVPDFGEPEIFSETCELVGVSYVDQVFTVVTDACYKIERTWTVINWCVVGAEIDQEVVEASEQAMNLDLDGDGDKDNRTFRDSWTVSNKPAAAQANVSVGPDTDTDSDPWDGYITYKQVIKVNDSVDPVFTNGCQIPDVCIEENNCAATVILPQPEITECSPTVTFTVSSALGSGFGPFINAGPGVYSVTYTAKDNCNNQTACTTTVTVKDCKKPTPYCVNGLVVELGLPGTLVLSPSSFNAGSYDNCTPQNNLQLSFSANTSQTSLTVGCDEVGQNLIQLWVTDGAGNQDYCETFVEVQDNMNVCDPSGNPLISGLIQTEGQVNVSDVDVQLSGAAQSSFMTTNAGTFNFNVAAGNDYTVTPVKDNDPLNGVTTFDLVLITKHILGAQLLNTPYKIIAADANKSNSVTTFDLVQLRKLILFIDTTFPNNTSWRFVESGYIFPDPTNPWAAMIPEVANINDIAANQTAVDFVAIKVGDVNGSAQANLAAAGDDRNATGSLVFNVEEAALNAGDVYTVDFKAGDFDVFGYQFTLNFDASVLEFVQVNSAVARAENFGLTMLDEGVITTSWNDNDTRLAKDEVVFSLVFKANASAMLSDVLSVNSRYTAAEAYKRNGELLDVQLAFNGVQGTGNFALYQNTPNPFSANTVVGFNLPTACTATLTITDVSGKVVKMITGDYAKGYNEIRLERRELPSSGILYYQLDTPSDSATKMMLLMD